MMEQVLSIKLVKNGHNSTLQLLLNNGADFNVCMNDGASPLFIACQKGDDTIFASLTES